MKADYVHKDSKTSTDETISYKITMPLINTEELQRIDNRYNEIIDEITNQFVKEKDMIIAQRIMMNLRKENKQLQEENQKSKEEKQELIDYLKKEQDRLVRECSPIYEDGLGKTRLVNEDIYNEVSKILSKIEKSDK